MSKLYIDLAVPIAVHQLFTYFVPPQYRSKIKLGVRVLAPFGKKTIIGVVVNILNKTNLTVTKDILDVLDNEPLISEEMLKLVKWISEYYFAPLGESLKVSLPPQILSESKKVITLIENDFNSILEKTSDSAVQREIVEFLSKVKEIKINALQKKIGKKNLYHSINELIDKKIVNVTEKLFCSSAKPKIRKVVIVSEFAKKNWQKWLDKIKAPNDKRLVKQKLVIETLLKCSEGKLITLTDLLKCSGSSLSTLKTLEKNNVVKTEYVEVKPHIKYAMHGIEQENIVMNKHQTEAYKQLCMAIDENKFRAFLLHGVTGSGKTQVYIETIQYLLGIGKTAIVLVPEISLTHQIVARFQMYFSDMVVVFHSKMTPAERTYAWQLAKRGECSIVIGPRSAVFAPFKNIGLIIVDEEQEYAYKQFDKLPRYNARDVAVVRARANNAVVVLGSATPSVESYYNVKIGKYQLIELPERVVNAQLPEVKIVDMIVERQKKFEIYRAERKAEFEKDASAARASKRKIEFGTISDLLKNRIEERLSKKEGIILLQNRRGFSPFVECMECGHVEMCENCSVTLTFHSTKKHLRCHYCGFVKIPPELCPNCCGMQLTYKGAGTQRIEDELQKMFPQAKIVRMDLDTTTRKGAHSKILQQFALGEFDILLGTQMVAKGLDFSRVTLVGVISADTQMLLPDFRSSERTFQLLTQVSGRAGRSGKLKGEVIIQTYQPNHYSLQYVLNHDYIGFFNEEIKNRKELHYPPFSRIALIEIKGKNESEVSREAIKIYNLMNAKNSSLIILGPAEAAISKVKSYYRRHILIKDLKSKDPSGSKLMNALTKTLHQYNEMKLGKSHQVKVTIDVDPVGMM